MPISESNLDATNVPLRVFLYTLDQITLMTSISDKSLKETHLYFVGRSDGYHQKWQMRAVNVAAPTDKPDWRVADREFIRWMRFKGFRVVERGYVKG